MFSSRSRESRTNLFGWRSISNQCSLLFSEQKLGECKKKVLKNKKKKKLWIIRVPKKLDSETRELVNKYGISLSNFVRKSVYYQTQDEKPETTGEKFVVWLIQVHKNLDRSMRVLAKANYPCMSSLIRFAVSRQINEKRLEHEHQNRRQQLFEENFLLKKELKKLKKNNLHARFLTEEKEGGIE